ncbi:hypothetical protein LPJ54_007321, partial [Coemansia sp. RSA 1824]
PEEPIMAPVLEETAVAPVLEALVATAEPEEPTMAELDDIYYSNIANVSEPHHYPFPSNAELQHPCNITLPQTAVPSTLKAVLEQRLLARVLAGNVPREQQRGLT